MCLVCRSQWPRSLRHELSSLLGRWDCAFDSHSGHGCLVCVCVYSVCVVLCVGSGLATGWSLVRGILSYRLWKMITELNKRPGPWMGWKRHCKKNLDSLLGDNIIIISIQRNRIRRLLGSWSGKMPERTRYVFLILGMRVYIILK
jgi:hypothetical protein